MRRAKFPYEIAQLSVRETIVSRTMTILSLLFICLTTVESNAAVQVTAQNKCVYYGSSTTITGIHSLSERFLVLKTSSDGEPLLFIAKDVAAAAGQNLPALARAISLENIDLNIECLAGGGSAQKISIVLK